MTSSARSGVIKARFRQLRYSNEILSHGVSELEAVYLRMESGTVQDVKGAQQDACTLNNKNHDLARAINTALKELESTLRQHMNEREEMKDLVHEFVGVLRESIETINDYRMIQEAYHGITSDSGKRSRSSNPGVLKGNRLLPDVIQRAIKLICICGT